MGALIVLEKISLARYLEEWRGPAVVLEWPKVVELAPNVPALRILPALDEDAVEHVIK